MNVAEIYIDIDKHSSYLKVFDTFVHEFCHVLTSEERTEHGEEFYAVFMAVLSIHKTQNIGLRFAGIERKDLDSLRVSEVC